MARISSFHFSEQDNEKLKSIGLHVGDEIPEPMLFATIAKIFKETNLNVMIVHNEGASSTVYVDKGTFKQR